MTADSGVETYAELAESRARLVAEADASRLALQHELHDGAQQRLVHALIALKLARSALDPGSPAAGLVDEALTNVEQANRDLRTTVHRVLPRSLVHGGLGSGLRSLVDGLDVPVGLRVTAPRLRPEQEATAYVVVAEVVRAAVEQARAREVEVDVGLSGATLAVDIRYAGIPVPDHATRDGTGQDLAHARDRARAAGGSLTFTGLRAGRAAVRVELPVQAAGGVTARG